MLLVPDVQVIATLLALEFANLFTPCRKVKEKAGSVISAVTSKLSSTTLEEE